MKKRFHLPLLAALPAVLTACPDVQGQQQDYNSYAECRLAYQDQIQANPWADDPCEDDDGHSYKAKPSTYGTTSNTYKTPSSGLGLSSSTPKVSPRPQTVKPAAVTRGGLTSTPRASVSSSGGSYGG